MNQLNENEVTIKTLIGCFKSAFMKTLDETEDSFRVQGENLKTGIFIDEKRKYLRLRIIYGLSGKVSFSDAAVKANTVNEEYLYIKFAVFEVEGEIYVQSDYYMTFEEGLNIYHLINLAKRFEKSTVDALKEYFNDYL